MATANSSNSQVTYPSEIDAVHTTGQLLIQTLWEGRWWFLFFITFSILACAVYLHMAVPRYCSTACIFVKQEVPSVLGENSTEKRSKNYLYTQAEILRSRTVLEPIIQRARLEEDTSSLHHVVQRTDALEYLLKNLTAKVGKQDEIIRLSFMATNPEESAHVVNAVIDAYIAYQANHQKATSAELLRILKEEKAQRDSDLKYTMEVVTEFKRANSHLIFDGSAGNPISERLARFGDVLTQAQIDTLEAEAHYAIQKAMLEDPSLIRQYIHAQRSNIILNPSADEASILRAKVNQLQLQLERLLRVMTPEHPSVQALEDQITVLFRQIEQLDQQFVLSQIALAEQSLNVARQKEQKILDHYHEQEKLTSEANEKIAQYTLLEAEYQQAKKVCDLLTERIKEVDISDGAGGLDIHVLEKARPSLRPAAPQKEKVAGIALAGGIFLGFLTTFMRDFIHPRFRSLQELAVLFRTPVLAVIPSLPKRLFRPDKTWAVYTDPDGIMARSLRKACAALAFGMDKEQNQVILVTSPEDGQGKTTVASNLAASLALLGRRVLLIEMNFRNPSIASLLGLENCPGITDVVFKRCSIPKATTPTVIDGFFFMDRGQTCVDSARMLGEGHFLTILRILTCQYDHLILDGPSVLMSSDAMILSAAANGVIVTVDGKALLCDTLMQAQKDLESVGATIIGLVVNSKQRFQLGGRLGQTISYSGRRGLALPFSVPTHDIQEEMQSDPIESQGVGV
ncbi:MAG: polysaccharide biosynthesis tyrosine autokinase [Sedimentisphaerales bacterium]|nr:polysaccharide biosynthesis tyrosine autokinase [Sedimentisphaerales bacterium]